MATKNRKLMKEISDQFLHCKICLEPFKNPKTLSCLHTFCFECLQQHLEAENSRSRFAIYNRNITCPLCRKKTELPSGSVRRLPDNFLLSNLTEIIDRRRPSTIPPCEICPSGVRGNNASSKCLDCSKLLCKSCVELHLSTKVTRGHTLIDIEGEKDIECKEHPEEVVRFYCDPCDTCICVVCTFQEHRDHEICSFTDGYSRYKNSMETLLDKCKKRLGDVIERVDMIDKCEQSLKQTRENIRDLAISYIQQVRQTEKELLRKVESYFSDEVVNFINNREWLQENAEGLQSACNLAEIVMSDKGVEMLLLKKEMEEKLTSLLDPGLPTVPADFQPQFIRFVPGNVSFGTIKVNNNDSDEDLVNSSSSIEMSTSGTQTDQIEQKQESNNNPKQTLNGTKEFSTQTRQKRTVQKEVNTEPVNFNETKSENETVSTTKVDSCVQVITDAGSPSSGICVGCSEELRDKPTPVESGEAPKIQGIILMNSLDKDGKEWRRMRRSMIRSRRVQTDISVSNDDVAERHGLATNVAPVGRSFSCDDFIDDKIVRSIGLDPIFVEPQVDTAKEPPRARMRHKTTMTTCEMKPVVPTTDKMVSTNVPQLRTFHTQTVKDAKTVPTQTSKPLYSCKATATDFSGQKDQSTSTPQKTLVESETSMPAVTQSSTATLTEAPQTSERAISTEGCETEDCGTGTDQPINCDQEIQVMPCYYDKNTNTGPTDVRNQKSQTDSAEEQSDNRKSWHGGTSFFSKLFKSKGSGSNTSLQDQTLSSTSSLQVCTVDSSTETNEPILCDKETGTQKPVSVDQWTETASPVMVNTGISPPRPLFVDSSVETNHVTTMDQGTYTEVVQQKHVGVDTVIIVHDNETLTEKIRCQDAQTSIDLICDTNETNTESKVLMDASVSTIDDWLRLSKPDSYDVSTTTHTPDILTTGTNTSSMSLSENFLFMNSERSTPSNIDKRDFGTMALSFAQSTSSMSDEMTQTFTVTLYDKSVSTSREYIPEHERKIDKCEMSTSTESLPIMGLLSELDGDELFLIPGSAFDKAPSIESLTLYEEEGIEMVDDGTSMEDLIQEDTSTQTLQTAASLDLALFSDDDKFKVTREEIGNNLVDVGVNTLPKLTFEKETSTPIRHLFSKGTMTFYIAKTDKATSTFSSTRQIAESIFSQKSTHDKANKETMTTTHELKDASTATESNVSNGKMAECISRLRHVSDRLNSPTNKSAPEPPWQKPNDDGSTEEKTMSANIEGSVEITKRKEKPQQRKMQPITSLKGKVASPDASTEDSKPRSLPRPGNTAVKMGSQSSAANRKAMPKVNSTPTKMATSPKPGAKKLGSTQVNGSQGKLSVTESTDRPKTPGSRRKAKSPMSPTSESRRSSTGSNASTSNQPSDALDLNSLRIPSPKTVSGRQSPAGTPSSPKAKRDKTPDERKSTSNVGFMHKLFAKKKKQEEEKTPPSPKRTGKKFTMPPQPPPEPPKPQKPQKSKAFVYMRQRIFSIEHDNEQPARRGSKGDSAEGRRESSDSSSSLTAGTGDDRPPSTYDNL